MSKQVTVYTLEELKDQFPEAYERVLKRWQDQETEWYWGDDTIKSLRAVIEACGGSLQDWSIGPESYRSYVKVNISEPDPWDDWEAPEDDPDAEPDPINLADWLFENVLEPNGYKRNEDGSIDFPGVCPFTGYCADDTFLEALWKSVYEDGEESLKDALEGLYYDACKLCEADLEQQQSEEVMEACWGDRYFTEDGAEV